MTTAIVTDSTTSLPDGVADRPDVRVVPLSFSFGPEESYRDKVDLSNASFYEKLAESPHFPTTSQPSAGVGVPRRRCSSRASASESGEDRAPASSSSRTSPRE